MSTNSRATTYFRSHSFLGCSGWVANQRARRQKFVRKTQPRTTPLAPSGQSTVYKFSNQRITVLVMLQPHGMEAQMSCMANVASCYPRQASTVLTTALTSTRGLPLPNNQGYVWLFEPHCCKVAASAEAKNLSAPALTRCFHQRHRHNLLLSICSRSERKLGLLTARCDHQTYCYVD
mmetsp:Transcript_43962/g.87209  ORF Transcript_43962/g.87209 Transcript_43962/m.87209 type:complete len:177 (+) Transcript_43962:680-1210(+)